MEEAKKEQAEQVDVSEDEIATEAAPEAEDEQTEETPVASVDEDEVEETPVADTADTAPELSTDVDSSEPEKMLTQSQVNELVGRARQEGRESAMRELFSRYGVSGDDELNSVFGRGQIYSDLEDEFRAQGDNYRATLAENALLKSRADESRWEDIKLILGGKGLDVTMENIESLIPSHPEWRTSTVANAQQQQVQSEPVMVTREVADGIKEEGAAQATAKRDVEERSTLRKFGGEATPVREAAVEESEDERLRRLFGV